MLQSIASLVSTSLDHHMLYDLELHHCSSQSYGSRMVQDTSTQIYPCRGIITRSADRAVHNGITKRGTVQAIILACSLAKEPCVGDVIIATCGPFAGKSFRVAEESGAVISTDAAGATYSITLVE